MERHSRGQTTSSDTKPIVSGEKLIHQLIRTGYSQAKGWHTCTDSARPRFECEHCKRGFARADVLAKHVGRAHGRRSGSGSETPTRQLSEEEAAETSHPAAKRARPDGPTVKESLASYASIPDLPGRTPSQWVHLRDVQSHGSARPPQAATNSNIVNNDSNGFTNVSTPSANIDFSSSSYNVDGLFSLNALASAASGPGGSSNGVSISTMPSTTSLPSYGLTDMTNQGLDENISPAGTTDSNFEHTFAWLFGNTADASSFAPPVDNFSSILFAQAPVEPSQPWSMSGFNTNQALADPAPTFQTVSQQQAPMANTSAIKPLYDTAASGTEAAAIYPIDNRVAVSFVNGNTLDEPKPLIDNARRNEMLSILQNSADRDAFDACFTCKKLNSMVELYFIGFDPFYPVLHRPTMPYRQNSPFLLLAVVSSETAA